MDRTTKTQIVVGDKKFNRRGNEVGASSWRDDYIYAPLDQYTEGRTWLDIAQADMAKRAGKAMRDKLTALINDKLATAPIETLEEVAKILGLYGLE